MLDADFEIVGFKKVEIQLKGDGARYVCERICALLNRQTPPPTKPELKAISDRVDRNFQKFNNHLDGHP